MYARMFTFTKAILLAAIFLGCMSVAQAQISVGIRIGPPPRPRVVHVVPPRPGPDFLWVGGYWYPVGNHYRWHGGYWTRPPYEGAHWIAPHHDGHQFFAGYWDGPHGQLAHDHRWDRERDRDQNHDNHDHDQGHDR